MKLLSFLFFIFITFSVFANCAAPIELALSVDENEPGRVILEYSEFSAVDNIDKPEGFVYRAKRSNDEWVDIHQFEIVDVEGVDEYFIAAEDCVPAGEWTYIIPFGCYEYACICYNFGSITIDGYSSNCMNLSMVSDITSEEFEQMQRSKTDSYPTDDDYGNDDDIPDSQIDSDDTGPVETKDDEQAIDIDPSSDVDKTNDEDVKETSESGKSDGCSVLVF